MVTGLVIWWDYSLLLGFRGKGFWVGVGEVRVPLRVRADDGGASAAHLVSQSYKRPPQLLWGPNVHLLHVGLGSREPITASPRVHHLPVL